MRSSDTTPIRSFPCLGFSVRHALRRAAPAFKRVAHPLDRAYPRRRDDRIIAQPRESFAAPAHGRLWHNSEVTNEASDFRLGGQSGLSAGVARTAALGPEPTSALQGTNWYVAKSWA